jgi:hypothetical protein
MGNFTEDVKVVNRLSGKVHQWELCEPVRYSLPQPDGEIIHVPPLFKTDFASVPRPLWFWVAPWGRHGRAAILHDFLYQHGSVIDSTGTMRRPSKREADRIFREAMAVLDTVILTNSELWRRFPAPVVSTRLAVAAPRRWLMWAAVATFGFRAYKRQQDKGSAPALEHQMLVDVAALIAAEGQGPDGAGDPGVPARSLQLT